MGQSKTEEDYLKAIYKLSKVQPKGVATKSIGDLLNIKPPTVSDMLRKLGDKKLIKYAKYEGVLLTSEGENIALKIIRKHRLWETFLVDHFNFKWDEVHDIAEQLEHIDSPELVNRLDEYLGFPKFDPHGDPIPDKEGVISPPSHTAFNGPEGLIHFIAQLRELSGGKPIGFKLCAGKKSEFDDICKAMLKTGVRPDFIGVDGGEGGTGAAPVEFSNSMGMPLRDGLSFVIDTLEGYGLKSDIKVIASGRVFSGFDIARLIALGADMVNSARAMMMATGCIQALQCNTNTCPTGVATQNQRLMKGLVVEDKAQRVANYHRGTVKSFVDLMAATGVSNPDNLNRKHINRRTEMNEVQKYSDIYPEVETGKFLKL